MEKKRPALRNLKPRTPDASVVAQIRKLRPNASASYPIRFFLYFSNEEMATSAANEMRLIGFDVDVLPPGGSLQWLCLASRNMVAETAVLVAVRGKLSALARKYKGEYDGWEAEISNESNGAG